MDISFNAVRTWALYFALCTATSPVVAQALIPATEDMRHNLQSASQTATLETAGTPAFQLQASFDTYDYLGKPDGSGTLTEEWLAPGTQRRVITFRGLTWTQVAHDGKVRVTGSSFEPSFMERRLVDALLSPGPSAQRARDVAPSYKSLKVGTMTLDCVILAPVDVVKASNSADKLPSAYCLSENPRIIRLVEERYALVLAYNHFVKLGDHLAAKDVTISRGKILRGTIHVTNFQAAPTLQESGFALPAGPDSSAEDVMVGSGVMSGELVNKVQPRYPEDAKQAHLAGAVTLAAHIDKAGSISHLEVISTPSESLADASLLAVRQWKYKPYLVNGEPTPVDTTITVNFSFSTTR